jgi:hypothetical protein
MARFWTTARTARLVDLANGGSSLDEILADDVIGAASLQALRNKCTRLHLTIAETHRRLVLTLPLADQRALAAAAQERGVEPELLAVRVLHCALEVLDAVLDDRDGMAA